jgi:hypothetical protein
MNTHSFGFSAIHLRWSSVVYQPRNIGVKEMVKGNIHTLANIKTTVFLFNSNGYSNGRQIAKNLNRERESKVKWKLRIMKGMWNQLFITSSRPLFFSWIYCMPFAIALMVMGYWVGWWEKYSITPTESLTQFRQEFMTVKMRNEKVATERGKKITAHLSTEIQQRCNMLAVEK